MNTRNLWTQSGLAAAAALLLASLAIAPAQAGFSTCDPSIAALVENTQDCTIHDTYTQDFLETDPMTVNDDGGFFGFEDWEYLQKDDDLDAQSGTWMVAGDLWDDISHLLLVFKSGNVTLVGYLADTGATQGDWDTPFQQPDFEVRNPRDVSHLTYYVRGTVVDIPESSAFFLMLMGLVGLVVARRRTAN